MSEINDPNLSELTASENMDAIPLDSVFQPTHHVKLFHGNSNPGLAKAVADYLQIPLGKAMVTTFANKEIR